MFWVHDKFGKGLDDPNGSGWPDYLAELVWPNILDGVGRPKPVQAGLARWSRQA